MSLAGGGYSEEFRAAASLLVWWTVAVGLAFGFWPRARVPTRALVAGGGLLALAALSALSMGWAADDGHAFSEAVRVAGHLGVFVLVVVAAPAGSAALWLGGLAAGLVVVAGLALGSRIEPSLFPDQDLARLLPAVRTRLSYPLNYWNGLGAAMAAGLVLLVWLGAHGRGRGVRALATAAIPAPALALFLTSSRGAVAALAVGLLVLLAAGPGRARMLATGLVGGTGAGLLVAFAQAREAFVDARVDLPAAGSQGAEVLLALVVVGVACAGVRLAVDSGLSRLAVPRPAGIAAAALALVAAVALGAAADPGARWADFKRAPADPGSERGYVARHLTSGEGNGRYQFWETGLDAFQAQPLRGIGAGGYEAWWARHGSLAYYIRDAHSLFVEVLAELGLLGLVALIAFLAGAAGGLAVRRRAPGDAGVAAGGAAALLACAVTSAAIDWSWEVPAAILPLLVAAGVLAGPAVSPGPAGREPRFGLGLVTLGCAWLAVVASALALVSEIKLADSRSAARAGDLDAAAADAVDARAVVPWSSRPRLQLALVRELAGDLAGARAAAAEAARRDSDDWRVWVVMARLAVKAGDVAAARDAQRRARELNPRSPLFRIDAR